MAYLFTSESVSEGHPDKIADQISDALIDNFLAFDPASKVACETLVTTGQVILAGEVKSSTYLDVQTIARDVIKKIGYPIVIKPLDGNHGKGASINVKTWEDAVEGLAYAKKYSRRVIVEKFITGFDFRVLIIDNKLVAAAKRDRHRYIQ